VLDGADDEDKPAIVGDVVRVAVTVAVSDTLVVGDRNGVEDATTTVPDATGVKDTVCANVVDTEAPGDVTVTAGDLVVGGEDGND
jgi:hypothetical protein